MQPATQGEKEVASVRRILLLVTVAAVMAALILVASPAFAAPGGQGDENRAMPRETGDTPSQSVAALSELAPPTIPPGFGKRPESVENKGRRPLTGPF